MRHAMFIAWSITCPHPHAADEADRKEPTHWPGGQLLGQRSGAALAALRTANRIRSGLLLFDEPESALSPQRQLVLLAHMAQLTGAGHSQFIIATHSPILLTFPGARILSFDGPAIHEVSLDGTSH